MGSGGFQFCTGPFRMYALIIGPGLLFRSVHMRFISLVPQAVVYARTLSKLFDRELYMLSINHSPLS